MDFPDRILFGADLVPEESMYRLYFRFFETADEYFDYPSHASRQGRWQIHGIHLPDDVLRKVYRENALRLLNRFASTSMFDVENHEAANEPRVTGVRTQRSCLRVALSSVGSAGCTGRVEA